MYCKVIILQKIIYKYCSDIVLLLQIDLLYIIISYTYFHSINNYLMFWIDYVNFIITKLFPIWIKNANIIVKRNFLTLLNLLQFINVVQIKMATQFVYRLNVSHMRRIKSWQHQRFSSANLLLLINVTLTIWMRLVSNKSKIKSYNF